MAVLLATCRYAAVGATWETASERSAMGLKLAGGFLDPPNMCSIGYSWSEPWSERWFYTIRYPQGQGLRSGILSGRCGKRGEGGEGNRCDWGVETFEDEDGDNENLKELDIEARQRLRHYISVESHRHRAVGPVHLFTSWGKDIVGWRRRHPACAGTVDDKTTKLPKIGQGRNTFLVGLSFHFATSDK
ncbi:hypothetical protein EI94DRAFT_1706790 [Lactarius quietus]|nr:hypothetical protein EI94DRAFT_1706790 [Lactarius quietus]